MIIRILLKRKEKMFMLTEARKKQIEVIVDNIIDKNGLRTPGFDLAEFLCKKEGFKIGQQAIIDGTTGLLFINDEDFIPNTKTHKLIVVNRNLEKEPNYKKRRRYIVAHEYAHSILHKKNTIQYAHRDADKVNNPEELEADYFARCLLMPKNLVYSVLNGDITKNMSSDEKALLISRIFNVTPKKARIRLEQDLGVVWE